MGISASQTPGDEGEDVDEQSGEEEQEDDVEQVDDVEQEDDDEEVDEILGVDEEEGPAKIAKITILYADGEEYVWETEQLKKYIGSIFRSPVPFVKPTSISTLEERLARE